MHIAQAVKLYKASQTPSSIRDGLAPGRSRQLILEFTYGEGATATNIYSLIKQQRITKPTAAFEPNTGSAVTEQPGSKALTYAASC